MAQEQNNTKKEYDITRNPNFKKLLKILVCPRCKDQIIYQQEHRRWLCKDCERYYFIEEGVPNFLIDEAVVMIKSPDTGKLLQFEKSTAKYTNTSGEIFTLKEIEKILNLKLNCLETGCKGELRFDPDKTSYTCSRCNTLYPIPNGITGCLKDNSYIDTTRKNSNQQYP